MDTLTPPRALHLIDVENLVGTGHPTAGDLNQVRQIYSALGIAEDLDHLVVACNPYVAVEVGCTWSTARLRVGHGPSGADHQLLDVLRYERVIERFDQVVIASGDGIFTDVTVMLESAGTPVTVVCRAESLALRLRMAASQVIYIDTPAAEAAARKVA